MSSSVASLGGGVEGSPLGEASPCAIKNISGETIPGYSFVKITPLTRLPNGLWVVQGDKPDDEEGALYVVSGRAPIGVDKTGAGFWIGSVPVSVKVPDVGSLEPIQDIGPTDGAWTADGEGTGFKCVGTADGQELAWIVSVGSVSKCELKTKILVMGFPSSGNLTLPVTVNSVQENVVIAMPANAASIISAFEGHSEIPSGAVHVDVKGASLPYAEATIWIDDLDPSQYLIGNWSSTMTGGPHTAYAVISYCC